VRLKAQYHRWRRGQVQPLHALDRIHWRDRLRPFGAVLLKHGIIYLQRMRRWLRKDLHGYNEWLVIGAARLTGRHEPLARRRYLGGLGRLDRLGRTLKHAILLNSDLSEKGIRFKSL